MDINEKITLYMQEKEKENAAKKAADALKESIIAAMGDNKTLVTDAYSVILKETKSTRLDSKKLYAEFGEKQVKELYGKETISRSLDIAARENAEKASA